jgi:hypothetical protein
MIEGEKLGLASDTKWTTALHHNFVDQVKLAMASPERGLFFHGERTYYRHENGSIYRKIDE